MIESAARAYRVAALPTEYGSTVVNQLFTRGYDQWDGDKHALIGDVERFGATALKSGAADAPFVETPSQLAVVATLASIAVLETERFADSPREFVQPVLEIQDCYVGTLKRLLSERGDPSIHQDIAEVLYAKPVSESEPYGSRICTDITDETPFNGPEQWYVEIPVTAASTDCIVIEESVEAAEQEQTRQAAPSLAFDGGSKTVETRWADNCFYVPMTDLNRQFSAYMKADGEAFMRLLDVHQERLSTEQVAWVRDEEAAITERLDMFDDLGQYERLWHGWEPGQKLVEVLQSALRAAGPEEIAPGEFLPARVLYAALEKYVPEEGWEERVIEGVEGPHSLANQLVEHSDHSAVEIDESEVTNRYKIGFTGGYGTAKQVEISDLEDFFELPCFAQLDERLQEKEPVRKDLYNFVRMAWWLPQYKTASRETFIEDIKDLFSRWPWFDPRITEQQVRYELRQNGKEEFDGNDPLPMNCGNESMQRYCIGQHRCPYTIYGSIPFRDEMYEQLGDEADGEEASETEQLSGEGAGQAPAESGSNDPTGGEDTGGEDNRSGDDPDSQPD